MQTFEDAWAEHHAALERYVRFRITNPADAEDVLQEVFKAALEHFSQVKNKENAKPWLVGIARNKCADYYRRLYRRTELPLDIACRIPFCPAAFGSARDSIVQDTMEKLSLQDQQILRLCYWQECSLQEISQTLSLPLGTVKSRLHYARERFRAAFPTAVKGDNNMSVKMPRILPTYTITPMDQPPFPCQWNELMGWFIVPRLGEKLCWAMYDFPDRLRTESNELQVTGRAMVHGIEGVEIEVRTFDPMVNNQTGDDERYVQRSFVAQLTDTHCRILSETHTQGGVKKMFTFLDGDAFLNNWGFGEDNCGNETLLRPKGDIHRSGSEITTVSKPFLLDVTGRFLVTINGKSYDTICVMDVETYGECVSEQYIDRNGRTILWRRFNQDEWHYDHYGRRWSDMLPDSETLTVNGRLYVHWYDCITSYIL